MPKPPAPASRPPRGVVVLVEDDPAVVESLRFALELDGYEVTAFPDAERLLDCSLPEAGAFLIVDVRLPGLNGLAAVQILRGRGVALPAVMITTAPTAEMRRRADALNAPIIEKPLLSDELLRAVHEALPTHH